MRTCSAQLHGPRKPGLLPGSAGHAVNVHLTTLYQKEHLSPRIGKKLGHYNFHANAVQAVPAASSDATITFPPHFYDAQQRLLLKNLSYPQLEAWCLSNGEDQKRALQLWRWLYADGFWMRSVEETASKQNGFGKSFREKHASKLSADGGLILKNIAMAEDGTRKLVFELANGAGKGGTVETVLIPVVREQGQKPRITICISSQVGCAMNCQFCYTGRMGLLGNLTTAQIVEQVVFARRLLHEERCAVVGDRSPITTATNVVFMGTGEPLHNLEAVLPAVDILCHPLGLHFSHNKVTVSTVGLVPELQHFSTHSRAQLAVSLHAPNDVIRDWIAPINRRWPLHELLGCLRELYPKSSADRGTISTLDGHLDNHEAPEHRTGADSAGPSAACSGAEGHAAASGSSAGSGSSVVPEAPAEDLGTDSSAGYYGHSSAGVVARVDKSGASGAGPDVGSDLSWQAVTKPLARRIGRHVLFEYVMLEGVNDSEDCARQLLEVTQGIEAKFNLIEFNTHSGTRFRGSSPDQIRKFRSVLIRGGRVCTIRNSRGDDEMAACGQLGNPDVLAAAGRPLPPLLEPPRSLQHLLQQST